MRYVIWVSLWMTTDLEAASQIPSKKCSFFFTYVSEYDKNMYELTCNNFSPDDVVNTLQPSAYQSF